MCSVPFHPRVLGRSAQAYALDAALAGLAGSLGLSLKVHWWKSSWPILLCSVHLDGVFPQSEKLKKLVFCPLLQGHQSSCFLLQVLIDGKNDLGPLLCLLVSGVPEEPLQGLLIYVFKDVAHSFLARGRVKVVAVDGRAYSKRRGHAGGLVAWLCFHRCGSSPAQLGHFQESVVKTFPRLLFKVWTKLLTQITLVTSHWSQGGKPTAKLTVELPNIWLGILERPSKPCSMRASYGLPSWHPRLQKLKPEETEEHQGSKSLPTIETRSPAKLKRASVSTDFKNVGQTLAAWGFVTFGRPYKGGAAC